MFSTVSSTQKLSMLNLKIIIFCRRNNHQLRMLQSLKCQFFSGLSFVIALSIQMNANVSSVSGKFTQVSYLTVSSVKPCAVVGQFVLLSSQCCVEQRLYSVTLQWQLKVRHGGIIYNAEINKFQNLGLPYFQLVSNILSVYLLYREQSQNSENKSLKYSHPTYSQLTKYTQVSYYRQNSISSLIASLLSFCTYI